MEPSRGEEMAPLPIGGYTPTYFFQKSDRKSKRRKEKKQVCLSVEGRTPAIVYLVALGVQQYKALQCTSNIFVRD